MMTMSPALLPLLTMNDESLFQNTHSAVFSVLSHVLEKDDLSPTEFEDARPKDDYIDHEVLRNWFRNRLQVTDDHLMSLREIWRNFCYEHQLYCSLPLFGNVVYRHVLQECPEWTNVTKTGDVKQKRYNLGWIQPPASEEQLDAFFTTIKEEKERVEKKINKEIPCTDSGVIKSSIFLDPEVLGSWWEKRLEPTDPSNCRMRMRDVYERFYAETGVDMPKALFGELSVRYVLSKPKFANVVRKGKIHNKRYSLRWKDEPKFIENLWGASTDGEKELSSNKASCQRQLFVKKGSQRVASQVGLLASA